MKTDQILFNYTYRFQSYKFAIVWGTGDDKKEKVPSALVNFR